MTSLARSRRLPWIAAFSLFLSIVTVTPVQAQLPETYEELIEGANPVSYFRFEETACEKLFPTDPEPRCRVNNSISSAELEGESWPNVTLGGSAGLAGGGVAHSFSPSTDFDSGIYLDPFSIGPPFTHHVDPLTLELWVQTSADPGVPQALAGMDEPGEFAGGGYALELTADGRPRGIVVLETSQSPWEYTEVTVTSDTPINDGAAHHIVLTKTNTTVTLYVDGVAKDSAATNGLSVAYQGCFCSFEDDAQFWIGRRLIADETNPRTFSGVIDELAIYDYALNASEVDIHYDFDPALFEERYLKGMVRWFGTIGDPVNTVTGNFYQETTDLDFPTSVYGLDWTRYYNSTDTLETELGSAWTHGHAVRIESVDGDGIVTMVLADSREVDFEPDGSGGYIRPMAFYGELVDNGDGTYTAEMFNGETWNFDSTGRLDDMTNWDDQAVTYTYGADGPTQITSSTGYSLTINYNGSGLVDQVTSSDGRTVSYTYNGEGRLETITDTDGDTTTYSYNPDGLLESITDPEGVVVVSNTYDSLERVATQTFPGGQSSTFVYDYDNLETTITFQPSGETFVHQYNADGLLTGITDPNGEQVNLARRADGELTGATSRLGENLTQTFDANGNVLTSETTTGGETTYTYDSDDRLTSVTEPWGATTIYTYDGSERIPSTVTDPLGNTTTLDVVDGLVTSVTDPDGVTTTFTYNSERLLTAETNGAGDTTTYAYDAAGRVTSISTPLGNETTFSYDSEGRLLTSTDPTGATTTYVYDAAGRLESVTDPEGATTTHSYDPAGRLASTTDSRGAVTTFDYDAFDQLVTTTRPGGAITSNTWEELGRLDSTTDPLSRTTSFGYDVDGNRVSTTDPTGDTTTTSRDAAGRVTSVTDPLGRITSHSYDSSGRLSSTTDPTGAVTSFSYDDLGRTETITDPRGGVTTTAYTAGGRVGSVTDPNGDTTSYTYDDAGRLATVTDPEGGVTTYSYDADGRITQVVTPEGLATVTGYDEAGRPTAVTDPAGVTTTFSYNGRGDLVQTQRDGEGPRVFSFDDRDLLSATDPLGNTTTFGYDDRGNRVSMTDALGRTQTATFADDDQRTSVTDALGRITTVSYDGDGRVETVADPSGRTVTNAYDSAGQLVSQTFDDGSTISYAYDDAGRRVSMTDATGTTSYSYDSAGNLTSVSYPNGDILSYTYDLAGRRTQVTYPDGSTVDYAYDDNGRLTGVTHSAGGSAAYAYDDDGRLVSESLSDGTTRSYSYTDGRLTSYTQNGATTTVSYDSSGRITSTSGDEVWSFDYDNAGQLTSADGPSGVHSYSYDAVGNLVSKDGVTLTVDDANQLVSDSDGASYAYDEAGRLVGIVEADGTVKSYVYDSRGLLVEERITTTGSGGGGADPGEDICATATPDIVGTEGDDVLDGGSGSQVIFGLGGNDIIDAGSGSDIVCGGDGDDEIIGGSGVDQLVGGAGDDTIDAGPGLDTVYAGPGADVVDGDSGADTIFGWGGNDVLNGGTGADEIDGEAGTDTIDGGTGSDTCETEPTRINCEHDLTSTGGGGETPAEETVVSRVYDGDSLLTSITVTHPDSTTDVYELTWDRTLPIPQIIQVNLNGDTTSLVYGLNRAFGVTGTGTTGYEYSVLGDTTSGPLALGDSFDPYGQPATADATTVGFGYRGELHAGSHLYLRYRDLDPSLGRFTTVDPLAGVPSTTTVANHYAYAGNDPAGAVDPLGLRSRDSTLGIGPDGVGTPPSQGSHIPNWVKQVGGFFKGASEQVVNQVQGLAGAVVSNVSCVSAFVNPVTVLTLAKDACTPVVEGYVATSQAFIDDPVGFLLNTEAIAAEIREGNTGEAWGKAVLTATEVVLTGRFAAKSLRGPTVALAGVVDDLQAAVNRAVSRVGPGQGPVYGTRVHSAFADELAALGRSDVFSEVSYLDGRVVPYGTRGSVRVDAVVGSPGVPSAVFDLKTGGARLTSARISQIREHLPEGFQDIPVLELRPG